MKNGKTTIHKIAKELNLDSSTVSRALNNSDRVKKKTRDLIFQKAEEMGYQRNLIASSLRKRKSNTIGVVVPRISLYFFSSAIAGIEEAAFAAGYNVIISQSLEKVVREEGIVKNLISNQVDGLLISVSMETKTAKHLNILEENNVPLVFFDRHCDGLKKSSSVILDDEHAAFEATSHLIKMGCTRIAHFSGPQNLKIYHNRLKGYKSALETYNLSFNSDLVITSKLSEKDGILSVKILLESNIKFDSIFSANDLTAISAMKYLKNIGYRIPEDVAVVGISNEPMSEVIEPSLTTVDQSGFEIGKIACRLLIDSIEAEEKSTNISNKTVILKPTLLERESSRKH